MLGFTRIEWIEWTHGACSLKIAIGDPVERNKGFGSDALHLLMRFAFSELNLYRLSAVVGDDNQAGLRFFKRHGFVEEGRRRDHRRSDAGQEDVLEHPQGHEQGEDRGTAGDQVVAPEPAEE